MEWDPFVKLSRRCAVHLRTALLIAIITLVSTQRANATFSIVAVDTLTGTIGGAGASCISGSLIINDIIEGVGAFHTQSFWLAENQDTAHAMMSRGISVDSIIGWLRTHDPEFLPGNRQYLGVTLADPDSSAAFTGSENGNYKNHMLGVGYAIAGNVLLNQDVLDDMDSAFVNTIGPLEEKLMAALQGAKRVGADNRCVANDKSAISAFIKVVRIGDGVTPYLFENVHTTSGSTDPIDVLQGQFDNWKLTQQVDPAISTVDVSPDTLPASGVATSEVLITPLNHEGNAPIFGVDSVNATLVGDGSVSAVVDNLDGTFSATVTAPVIPGSATVVATAFVAGVGTEIGFSPEITFYLCGDADNSNSITIADVTYLIARIFSGGPAPVPEGAGDADGSGSLTIADVTYLIARIFGGGPPPECPE